MKQKQCKDCKWLRYENFESMVGQWCVKQRINRFGEGKPLDANKCCYYHRKWWKIWRAK